MLLALACTAPLQAQQKDAELWGAAVAYMRAGQNDQAIPLLQHLAQKNPGVAALHLELGAAYFRLGQDRAALRALKQAEDLRMADSQKRALRIYRHQIEARRKWRVFVWGGIMPQSNAARRTGADRIAIGGYEFILDDRPESGIGLDFGLNLAYRALPGPAWRQGLSVTLAGNVFEEETWNDYNLAIDASLQYDHESGSATTIGVSVRPRWLSDKRFTTDTGIYLEHLWLARPATPVSLRFEAVERRYSGAIRPEADILRVGLSFGHRLSDRTRLRGAISVTQIASDLASEAATITSLNLGVSHLVTEKWQVSLDASTAFERRDGPAPIFGITRDEREDRLRLRLTPMQFSLYGLRPSFELGAERRQSNIELFSWSNSFAGVQFSKAF